LPDISQFLKVAPYLINPLVLIGFCLFLFYGVLSALLKAGILAQLSQRQSGTVVRQILTYSFWVAVVLVVLGFGYAFRNYHDGRNKQGQVTQRAGDCSTNLNGDGNSQTVNCSEKSKK